MFIKNKTKESVPSINTHPTLMCAKTRHAKPRSLSTNLQESETTCYSEAAKHRILRKAMGIEIDALVNGTWDLVPQHNATNILGNKWLHRIKRLSNDNIDHYKARLVAKGFH